MIPWCEPDSSLTDILQILINYHPAPKHTKDNVDHLLAKKSNLNQTTDMTGLSSYSFSFKKEKPVAKLSLHQSHQKLYECKQQTQPTQVCFSHTTENGFLKQKKNIFSRLYEEKKELQMKRDRLIAEGRKSLEQRQRRECTFSPNVVKLKTEVQTSSHNFYQKNLQWCDRRYKQIKQKQCEKNSESASELTFTPIIVMVKLNQHAYKTSKENLPLQVKRGVKQFLNRQNKAKNNQQYIQERRKNPYSHVWNIKKGYFSYAK